MSRAKLILFLLSLSAPGFASAGDSLEVVRIGLAHDSIYAVERSQNTIWAVGGHGLVIRSTDNGTQWEPIASPGDFAALDISIDGGKPVLVGQSGKAFEADVVKGSWTQLETGTDQRLLSVASLSDGGHISVGAFGTIIRRFPDSASFSPVIVDWESVVEDGFEPHLYDVLQTRQGSILIAGEFGMILRSDDGGVNWSLQNSNESSVFAIHENDDGQLIGVGQAGYIILSTDDGKSWQESYEETSSNLLGVSSSGEHMVAVGVRAILSSNDGGKNWEPLENQIADRRWFQGIVALSSQKDGKQFLAGGQFGQIVNF